MTALRKQIFHFPAQIREKRLCARLCVRLCVAVVLCAAIVLRAVTCPQSSFERPPSLHMVTVQILHMHTLHLPLLKHQPCHSIAKHAIQALLFKCSWRSMCVKTHPIRKKRQILLFSCFYQKLKIQLSWVVQTCHLWVKKCIGSPLHVG